MFHHHFRIFRQLWMLHTAFSQTCATSYCKLLEKSENGGGTLCYIKTVHIFFSEGPTLKGKEIPSQLHNWMYSTRNVSSSFNQTRLNQRGLAGCLNWRPRHRHPGSCCCWGLSALFNGKQWHLGFDLLPAYFLTDFSIKETDLKWQPSGWWPASLTTRLPILYFQFHGRGVIWSYTLY